MTQVAAIVFSAHDKAFLRAIEATDALVYSMTREGTLRAVRGPDIEKVSVLPVRHVVWCGVPPVWVGKLGAMRFKAHYSSGTKTWRRSKDPSSAVQKIKAAYALVEREVAGAKKARDEAYAQSRLRVESSLFHRAPDWYIPQELR